MEINFPTAEVLENYRDLLSGMQIVHKPLAEENLVVFSTAGIGPVCIGKVTGYKTISQEHGEYVVYTDLIKEGLLVFIAEGLLYTDVKPKPVLTLVPTEG